MIAIINYGAGNIESISNALKSLDKDFIITDVPEEISKADKIIFPGVGSFGYMMENLNEKGIKEVLKQEIENKKPYLGICLGLHALFEESEESTGIKGLGIFKGKIKKFTKGRVPHIGWNNVDSKISALDKNYFYFVHSFHADPIDKDIIAGTTSYHEDFCSVIQKDNITAVQFHPERSGEKGIEFLREWLEGKV